MRHFSFRAEILTSKGSRGFLSFESTRRLAIRCIMQVVGQRHLAKKMPDNHPAFHAGEYVKFAKLEALEELQEKFGENGPQGRKWIHDLLASDMTEHAGMRVRIKSVSIYHFGTVLYEFDEVRGLWLEPAVVDRSLDEPSGHDIDRPAHLFYQVTTDGEFDQPGLVQIQGRKDQLTYCILRKNLAGREARNIAEVSRIRTKANFESRYGFDGHYEPFDAKVSSEMDPRD